MNTQAPLDLIVLVADADAEAGIGALLKRHEALQIRPIQFKILRHPGHDAGAYREAPEVLRPYLNQADYALVIFDREGCGKETFAATAIENDVEKRLAANGWQKHNQLCAGVIVLDPELEAWVWTKSPHVAGVIGLDQSRLNALLGSVPCNAAGKPERPKEALQKALRLAKKPVSPALYQKLAENVSLTGHTERAFHKLVSLLRTWFP